MNLDTSPAQDAQNMIDHIHAMPDHIESTWACARILPLPEALLAVRQIVICGMGGSAIGGDLVAAAAADRCPVPVLVNRAYTLPAFVGADTLVVACSHSGNTEETLSAFAEAGARGARRMAIATGGELVHRAEAEGVTAWTYAYDAQPRAALGFSLTLLLALVDRFASGLEGQIEETVERMRGQRVHLRPEAVIDANPAKTLAARLHGRIPAVFGAGAVVPVARRWVTQFNENSKTWAEFLAMPELNHNAVVGIDHPAGLAEQLGVVVLRSKLDSPRISQRYEETRRLLEERAGVEVHEVSGLGESRLTQMLTLVHYGDYVSYYLAAANRVDPTPIEAIERLKESLDKLP